MTIRLANVTWETCFEIIKDLPAAKRGFHWAVTAEPWSNIKAIWQCPDAPLGQ
jgi:hypothetical protein